jgi:hypothetical protein
MEYNKNTCEELVSFIVSIKAFLLESKGIILSDLEAMESFLKDPSSKKVNGKLSFQFFSKERREVDNCVIYQNEIISLDKNGFDIRYIYNETYFDTRYLNNESRVDEETSLNEDIQSSLEAIRDISENPGFKIKHSNERFFISRVKS